jgi:hypothetical protein
VLDAGVEAVVEGAREVEDVLEGVEEPVLSLRGTAMCWRAGLSFGFLSLEESSCSEVPADASPSPSSSSEASSLGHSSRPLGYSAQDTVTWYRDIGVRFSSSAAKASKQNRQCSTVAMVTSGL